MSRRHTACTLLAALVAFAIPHAAGAQVPARDTLSTPAGGARHIQLMANELVWRDGPPSLPPGAQIAVLEGNPAEAGPVTMRLRFPDGYTVPPHFHPGVERVTVLSGMFVIGMGERVNWNTAKHLTAGAFTSMPPRMPHYAQAHGETVVQLNVIGPWGVTYVNEADDPRRPRPEK